MPNTRLRIAVRFDNAFAEQIALYRDLHPAIEFEAVPLDLRVLHSELFRNSELRSGACDVADEEISMGARRLPRSRSLPAFAAILNDVATAALATEESSAEILKRAQRRMSAQGIVLQ